jgi:arylsulfatase A-like enzyme
LSATGIATNRQIEGDTALGKGLLAAAIEGFAFWMAYGAVEFFAVTLLPLWNDSLGVATPVTWRWTARLLIAYAVAGAVTGAAGRLLASGKRAPAFQNRVERYAGSLALSIAFLIGLLLRFHLGGANLILLGEAVLLVVLLAAACWSESWELRLKPILRPWPVACLLLGPSTVNIDLVGGSSAVVRLLAYAAIVGMVVFVAWMTTRIAVLAGNRYRGAPRRLVVPAAITALLLGAAALLSSARSLDPVKAATLLSGTAQGRPNIVFLTLDTVRADHTSFGGYARDTTPVLNQLSKEWTVYNHLFGASDMTLTTHATMFTGLYPRQHGAWHVPIPGSPAGRPLESSFNTLAEVLAANGYSTASIAANAGWFTPFFGLTQGFQVSDVHSVMPLERSGTGYVRVLARTLLTPFTGTQDFDLGIRRSAEINSSVFPFLDELKRRGTSFFLFLNYMDAHTPYLPPAPFDRQYPGKDPSLRASHFAAMEPDGTGKVYNLTPRERDMLVSQYDGGIAYEDQQVGKLVDKLKSLGLYDNTLILITADHGEHLGDHQLFTHGISVYQSLIHVPLLIKYPHQSGGASVDAPVSQIDFMPTLLATAGIRAPAGLTGLDLRSVSSAPPRILFSASYQDHGFNNQTATAVISNGFKLIDSTRGTRELFDLARDPEEQHDLYKVTDPLSRQMRADLDEWKKIPAFRAKQDAQIDKENLDRLKSLGYVQ